MSNTLQTPVGQPPSQVPAPKSKGEKLFDWLSYGGVKVVGAFLASPAIAYPLKYDRFADAYKWGG